MPHYKMIYMLYDMTIKKLGGLDDVITRKRGNLLHFGVFSWYSSFLPFYMTCWRSQCYVLIFIFRDPVYPLRIKKQLS